MIRLHFVVEGQTEETFVRDVMSPHLAGFDVFADVRCVETSRTLVKVFKGGGSDYLKVKKDISSWMKQEKGSGVYFTSMLDLYRLPENFPGYDEAKKNFDVFERVRILESSFRNDIDESGYRFIPYIQVHEFEALLFTDITELDKVHPMRQKAIDNLSKMSESFNSPELINDNKPPSKRIIAQIEEYDKLMDGPIVTAEIGIYKIREKCMHFDEWLRKLENIKIHK